MPVGHTPPELFFGAAPTLEACLEEARARAKLQGNQHLVFRFKRMRNPHAVCLEALEHFLHDTQKTGLIVLLAGIRPDLLSAFARLRFADWFPQDRIFVEEDDDADSATLKAVRKAYAMLGDENYCAYCSTRPAVPSEPGAAYYLV